MKRILPYLLVMLLLGFVRCGEDSNTAVDQRDMFESYMTQKQLEYTVNGGVFRAVLNPDRPDAELAPTAINGDSIYYHFLAFVFNGSSSQQLFYTDRSEIIDADTVLNPQYWTRGPQKVQLGSTPMLGGLSNGLVDCRQGDSLLLLIPSEQGFGDKQLGSISPNTPLMYILTIEQVKKQ